MEANVWSSQVECQTVVEAGGRMADGTDRLRIATWNIRWFPDRTDLEWLACTLAWMNVDVVAVQKFKATREAYDALDAVTDSLGAYVGGNWRLDLQDCGGEERQHVEFLWNANRVSFTITMDRWRMNGAAEHGNGSDCDGNLRRRRSAYATVSGGVDLHLVSVHLDSGANDRDYNHKGIAIERINEMYDVLQTDVSDSDVMILGDFNTMGTNTVAAADEIADFRRNVARLPTPFVVLTPDLECSEYYKGKCGLLDHFALSTALAKGEAQGSIAVVTGYCKVELGRDLDPDDMPAA